ncbi:hypothetical protein EJ04DRAFT_515778 [Polyplosphaeria fusca]|uniref:Uncharacterized protein n=1 Tax=Polyplosphaeria fusca TaxID=682080 RepID=A0A9P4QQJ9_9PLEO|nr:hypothetical protein EJ04DRAFT_515778 [Polyplosphaeria fusca]
MPIKLFLISRLITFSKTVSQVLTTNFRHFRNFSSSRTMAALVDSQFLSKINASERALTNHDTPVKDGPTARAQSHANEELTAQVVSDITAGERVVTGSDSPAPGGPTSIAQSILAAALSGDASTTSARGGDGVVDGDLISKIIEKETEFSGESSPVKGGPTAQAQMHVGEPITSQVLSDVTKGEKKVTGGERFLGGPTATAQSRLAKSKQ